MLHTLLLFSLLSLLTSSEAHASSKGTKTHNQCNAKSLVPDNRVVSNLCVRGEIYRLFFDRNAGKIILVAKQHKLTLQEILKGYDPSLVGADRFIGFLPDSLQPYLGKNMLLSVSAIRTSAGGGGGQCGAGAEIYLNVIDIAKPEPKLESKILIASCAESIELFDQDISSGAMNGISVVDDHLSLHFMNYKDFDGSPTATVAPDFTRLLFK